MSDKALAEAEYERTRASSEAERAESAWQREIKEKEERQKAERWARKAQGDTQKTYRSLFIGNGVFTIVFAFFVAYSKGNILMEMLQWIPDRWDNVKSFACWVKNVYMGTTNLMNTWGLAVVWSYIIANVISFVVLVVIFFIAYRLLCGIIELKRLIGLEYKDKIFKAVVSADIILFLLYVCLFFYEPIKNIVSLNIFSIWLLFSVVGCAAWNFREIKGGIQDGYF